MRKENSLSRRNFVAVLELSPTITACGPNAQELVDQQVGLKFAALNAVQIAELVVASGSGLGRRGHADEG